MPSRHKILIVDDEQYILDSLALSLELDYDVLTATSGQAGLELLKSHEVVLIISDQRMPQMSGVAFLEAAAEISPRSIRMMLTGYADYDAIVEAINKGRIYRYLAKPWEPRDLEIDVRTAVEHYEVQTALDRRMMELQTLCEIGASVTSELSSPRVVQKVLDAVVETLGFNRSFLMLVDETEQILRCCGSAGVREEALAYVSELEYNLDRDDVAVVLSVKESRPILVEDVEDSPVSLDREAADRIGIRSFVATPLQVGEHSIGVLLADRSGNGDRVNEHDQRLLMGFADQAAIALENARLYEEALEKQRLEEEIAVAGRIQQNLLPKSLPKIPGFQVAGMSRPSRVTSGDYYDVVPDGTGRFWIALGDVSGKGMSAALTMATLRTLFLSEIERANSLPEAMNQVSEGLFRSTPPEMFATLCFGVLDPEARTFSYVNAGHPFPILAKRNGQTSEVSGAGIPAGMDPMFWKPDGYEEQQVVFDPGDVLVIFSDGVSEAGASDMDMFGEERIAQVVTKHRDYGAKKVQEGVCEAVECFVGGQAMDDDLTLVVIEAKTTD